MDEVGKREFVKHILREHKPLTWGLYVEGGSWKCTAWEGACRERFLTEEGLKKHVKSDHP